MEPQIGMNRPYVIITTPIQFIVISEREGKTLPYRI